MSLKIVFLMYYERKCIVFDCTIKANVELQSRSSFKFRNNRLEAITAG